MFDLEAAISQWRRQVESKWIGDQSALAELEDHLREEIAALAQSGHADEEAWKEAPEADKGKTKKKSSARASSTTTH